MVVGAPQARASSSSLSAAARAAARSPNSMYARIALVPQGTQAGLVMPEEVRRRPQSSRIRRPSCGLPWAMYRRPSASMMWPEIRGWQSP